MGWQTIDANPSIRFSRQNIDRDFLWCFTVRSSLDNEMGPGFFIECSFLLGVPILILLHGTLAAKLPRVAAFGK
jgi:hypothetical protein